MVGTAYFEDDDGNPVYGQVSHRYTDTGVEWVCYTVKDNKYDRSFGLFATVPACWEAISQVYHDKGAYSPRVKTQADMPSPEGGIDG
jgi:hypothetical protein